MITVPYDKIKYLLEGKCMSCYRSMNPSIDYYEDDDYDRSRECHLCMMRICNNCDRNKVFVDKCCKYCVCSRCDSMWEHCECDNNRPDKPDRVQDYINHN